MTREERKQENAMNYPASVLAWLNEITDAIYDDFESKCKDLSAKVSFYEQIDWVKLGKRLEYHNGYDGTGWENLGRAWRANDENGVIAHLYQAFNKAGNYSSIIEGNGVIPPEHQELLSEMINKSYMLQHYGKEV